MNKSNKIRKEILMTNLAEGYLQRLDSIASFKGLRGRNSAIEFLIDNQKQETMEYMKRRDSLIKSNEELKKTLQLNEEEINVLNEKIEAGKIYEEVKNGDKEVLYSNIDRVLEKLSKSDTTIDPETGVEITTDKPYLIKRAFLLAQNSGLDEMKCIKMVDKWKK